MTSVFPFISPTDFSVSERALQEQEAYLHDWCRFVQRVAHYRTVCLPSHMDITRSHMRCHGNTEE